MRKGLKNNKGSTLILLVMAVAVISLLGTSVLGVTMMNLKIKKANTELKKSFYLSESGLDKAYDKAYGMVLEAVKEGNEAAQSFTNGLNAEFSALSESLESDNTITYPIDIRYQECIEFLNNGGTYSLNLVDSKIEEKEKLEFANEYKSFLSNHKINELSGAYGDDGALEVAVNPQGWNVVGGEEQLKVEINSTYDLKEENTDRVTTKKTAVDLVIKIPSYNKSYTFETEQINVNPFWTKVLAADDLDIKGDSGTVNIDDKVFVSNDLTVEGDAVPNFNGDLAVRGNIVLGTRYPDTDAKGNINSKNVYANNILMEGSGSSFKSTGTDGLYIKDDLEINNSNQEFDITGSYYGFSDGTKSDGPDNSSSIIINNTSISNLTIAGNVYLYGSSYVSINDSVKYQTGESISVKGNYRAYLLPLPEGSKNRKNASIKGDDIHFAYYGDLYLADAFKNPDGSVGERLTVYDKADYLMQYGGSLYKPSVVNFGDRILSIGTALDNDGKPNIPTYDQLTFDTAMDIADGTYYKEIRQMGYGNAVLIGAERGSDTGIDKKYDDVGLMFDIQVPFEDITSEIEDTALNGAAKVYVNNDESDNYELNSNYSGLIVTKGDVTISGNVTFTGAIVCGGKVTIKADGGSKTFKHDKELIAKILAERQDLDKLFKQDTISDVMSFPVYKAVGLEDEGDSSTIDFSDFLEFHNWQIK